MNFADGPFLSEQGRRIGLNMECAQRLGYMQGLREACELFRDSALTVEQATLIALSRMDDANAWLAEHETGEEASA
jgi:hypothetical protein